jgi:hypothetical protein
MSTVTDTILKTYFETGDKPTESQFEDLIDSKVNVANYSFTGLTDVPGSYVGQSGNAFRVNSGETGLEFYTPITVPDVISKTSIANLKAVASADRKNNQICVLIDTTLVLYRLYYYNSASSATGDDDAVIEPNDSTGRWLILL